MSLSASDSTSATRGRWVLPLVWILIIFIFSTDSFSSAGTARVIVPVLKFLFPFLSPEQMGLLHIVCRKAGHVIEYFVLGALIWRAFTGGRTEEIKSTFLTVVLVLVVALSDEFHQSLVPSRTSTLVDVGYDMVGGLVALLLMARFRNAARTLHSHSIL